MYIYNLWVIALRRVFCLHASASFFPATPTRASATASLYAYRYPKEILNKKESSFLVTSLRLRLILKRELKYFILFPFGYCPFVRLLYKKFKLWACLVTQKRTKVTYSILFSSCDTWVWKSMLSISYITCSKLYTTIFET